ncbi:MAG: sodium:proton antiporter [Planctomycetaceae bacterium]|nr:sodium:proton antiporter [Planctomycetaceae bacterium]
MHSHDPSDDRPSIAARITRAFAVIATTGLAAALLLLPHAAPTSALPESWWIGVMPFAALLGAIAVFPLVPAVAHWWHSNLNRYAVSLVLALAALGFLAWHRGPEGVGYALHHAVPAEYVPFMSLLFALYVIAGGLRIGTPFDGKPRENLAILLVGALIASFIGTTGAAMLLIRPLLESIHRRKHRAHTIVFFIFIVCNCGGCLLPIGDPPLFMGYLRGVPFLWTMGLWKEWLLVNGLLLGAYAAIDTALLRKERREIQAADDHKRFFVEGAVNIPLLAAAIAAVALLVPGKELVGTGFIVPNFLREAVLFGLAGASWALTAKQVRRANNFEFGAIIEVAAIFIGIFITMQTPLEVLTASGPKLGMESPIAFYWVTGALSSFLDNAPTYVVFFEIAKTLPMAEGETYVQLANGVIREDLLTAVSLGAVFMGANTYIGNGPNFMVKAIAESDGIKMPSFFGYMAWSVGILLPLLALAEIFFP